MTESRRHDAIALAVLGVLVTALFLDVLIGLHNLYARDLSYYYYPAKHILRQIVLAGEFPSWNPFFAGGQPLAANPEHEVFYPLTWLVLLPDYRTAFHVLIWIHLVIAGAAMYALLRSMSLRAVAAFLGALSFAIGGMTLSYINLLPILFCVAWLPLTCLYTRRFLERRSWRDFALATLFFGIEVVIGEPTTVLQTGILLGLFAVIHGWKKGGWREACRATAIVGLISIGALLVGAIQALPTVDHARETVRSRGLTYEQTVDWSMPPVRAAEFLHPHLIGRNDLDGVRVIWAGKLYGTRKGPFVYSFYAGMLLAVLTIAGALTAVRGRAIAVTMIVASLLLACGAHTPVWRLLYETGLMRSLRYPEKFILMAAFAVTVFGSCALHAILAGDERTRRAALRVSAVVMVCAMAAALFTWTPWHARWFVRMWRPEPDRLETFLRIASFDWWMTFVRVAAVFLLLRRLPAVRRPLWVALTTAFVLIDLGSLMPDVSPRAAADFYDPPALNRLLPPERLPWRLFHHAGWHKESPQVQAYFELHPDSAWIHRNAMFPMRPAEFGIRMVLEGDFDLTALLPTVEFQTAVGELSDLTPHWMDLPVAMSNAWYRAVFLDPRVAFARARGDRRQLQAVAILPLEHHPRYYFAEVVEPVRDRHEFVRKIASGRFGKRAAFVYGPPLPAASGRVLRFAETSNTAEIVVEADAPAFLVMSVTPHKYWTITIDGREAAAVITNVGYQGVAIPSAGRHVVRMRYRNPLIAAGAGISLAALLAILGIAVRAGRMRSE